MSIESVNWAYKVRGIKSSAKFVLVAMAGFADADGYLWPSTAMIAEMTSMDRKTVIKAVDALEEAGLIVDSGMRKGTTRQVKIYKLRMDILYAGKAKNSTVEESLIWHCVEHERVPDFPENSPQNGTVEESQKRNSSKNGTVPNFPVKSTKFPGKEYQISPERVPNLGHGTINEPLKEPLGNHQVERARGAAPQTDPENSPEKSAEKLAAEIPAKLAKTGPVKTGQMAKRKTRLPDDWSLPKDWREWAMVQGMSEHDAMEEAIRFADHWWSNGESKADWLATWRNWVRRSREFSRIPVVAKRNEPESMGSLLERSAKDAEKFKYLFEAQE